MRILERSRRVLLLAWQSATSCAIVDLMANGRVAGVDACKRGWVAITLEDFITGIYFAKDIETLTALMQADGPVAVIAIDMPIGLPDRGDRKADSLARAVIGPLRPAVFMTPVRQALQAPDHAAASAINRKLTGHGISRQAFGLKTKLFEVEEWARHTPVRVVETHPEVCFARLAGSPLTLRKSSWAGVECRRTLLSSVGISLAADLGNAGEQAGVDDVLDAAGAAWAARQVLRGYAHPIPEPPETFTDGWPSAIWA
jgi:predicted RNase H-like nuclease